jgi:hypothetical protein
VARVMPAPLAVGHKPSTQACGLAAATAAGSAETTKAAKPAFNINELGFWMIRMARP